MKFFINSLQLGRREVVQDKGHAGLLAWLLAVGVE
jgi:hypothetical protein